MATDALRSIFAYFGVDFDDKELKKGDKTVRKTSNSIRELGATIAAGFAVDKIFGFVQSTLQMSSEIRRAAIQIGATNSEVAGLATMFQSVGLETDDVTDAIVTLQEKAMDASNGMQTYVDAFKRLGVEYKDAQGNLIGGVELFYKVADALSKTENASLRAGRAVELLDDAGRKLLPMFEDGADGLRAYIKETEELGGAPSKEFFALTKGLSKQLDRLRIAFSALRAKLAVDVMPAIIRFVVILTKATVAIGELLKNTQLLKVLVGVAAAIGLAFVPAVATFILAAAAILVIAIAVEDLIVFLQGGKSAIGELIDAIFGIGASKTVLDDLNLAGDALKLMWDDMTTAVERAKAAIAGFINPFATTREQTVYRTERAARAIENEGDLRPDSEVIRSGRAATAADDTRDLEREGQMQSASFRRRLSRMYGADVGTGDALRGVSATRLQSGQLRAAKAAAVDERRQGLMQTPGAIVAGQPVIGQGGRIIAREAPVRITERGPVTVGDSVIQLTINANDASAQDVAVIARRELEIILERNRRETLAAYETSAGEAS